MLNILKQNEKILIEECDKMLGVIIDKLDINKRADYLNLLEICSSKEKIEKNDCNQNKLNDLNILIPKLKQELNELLHQNKNFKDKTELIPTNNLFSIGQFNYKR